MIRKSLYAVAAVSLALSPIALARTHIGQMGVSTSPSDHTCWSISFGSKINSCTVIKKLYMPGVVDGSGDRTVTVNAEGANANENVGCIAYAVTKGGDFFDSSGPLEYLSMFGSPQDIVLTTITVPSQGALYVHCEVSPGGRVNSIRFAP